MSRVHSTSSLRVATAVFALAATAAAVVLTYQSVTRDTLPGCGPGSGCASVLGSRWSAWLGMPVSALAIGVYGAMLVGAVGTGRARRERTRRQMRLLLAFGGGTAVLAAGWFVGVQLLVIGELCRYCLVTHALGVGAAALALTLAGPALAPRELGGAGLAAAGAVALLVAGQVFGPAPAGGEAQTRFAEQTGDAASPPVPDPIRDEADPGNTERVGEYWASGAAPPTAPDLATPAEGAAADSAGDNGPIPTPPDTDRADPDSPASLFGGRFTLQRLGPPRLGPADAPRVLVCLFDYTCSHCRETRVMLEGVAEKYGDALAIFVLPAPLGAECNPGVPQTHYAHRHACDLARVSLAVWRADPDAWRELDHALYTDARMRTPGGARHVAGRLLGEAALAEALADPWADQQLDKQVRFYLDVGEAAGSFGLPILMSAQGVMNGAPSHPLFIDQLLAGEGAAAD